MFIQTQDTRFLIRFQYKDAFDAHIAVCYRTQIKVMAWLSNIGESFPVHVTNTLKGVFVLSVDNLVAHVNRLASYKGRAVGTARHRESKEYILN